MLSSRRLAELGLLAASLVLVGSIAVVVAGSSEGAKPSAQGSSSNSLAAAQMPGLTVAVHH